MPQQYLIIPPEGSELADEWVRVGSAAHLQGQLQYAESHYRSALRLDPNHIVATQNLAALFAQAGNMTEATLAIERASMLDGVNGYIYANHALIALETDRIDVALANARKAVELQPCSLTRMALAIIAGTAGLADEAMEQYNAVLEKEPNHPQAGPNSCFVQTLTMTTPECLIAQRKKWHAAHRFTGPNQPHPMPVLKDTLRVGYVSGDFKTHSAAMIFGNVLLNHDPSRIDLYLYSTLPVTADNDVMTKRFMQRAGDRWRDISQLNDEQADALIRRDGIDILVDLAAHTAGGKLALFTRRPAPLQVTAWGFAHGTGCPEIDYFFADEIAVPKSERQFYAEKVWDLPCIVSYLEPEAEKHMTTSRMPYHQNGCITFGSYARYEKLSDACLRTFAQIMQQLPTCRLQFKDHGFRRPYSIKRVLSFMGDVDPKRLLFQISTSHEDHMRAHRQADIILDPWPHGGGVVVLEQLYMGVPIVTMYGTQPSGRTGSSVLTSIGRPEWIAKTTHEYVEIACRLAKDIPGIQAERETLHERFMRSPVVAGYREKVEQAYFDMWRLKCEN